MNGKKVGFYLKYLLTFGFILSFILIISYYADMQSKHDSIIPRKVIFGNPDRTYVRISHDARHIAYLAPCEGVLNIYIADINNLENARCITHDTKRGIRTYFFAYDNKHIIYMQDKEGDEDWQIFKVNIKTGEEQRLSPESGVHALVYKLSYKRPDEILVGLNDRNPQFHDVYKINISTGEATLVYENNQFLGFLFDDELTLNFAVKQAADGGVEIYHLKDGSELEIFETIPVEDYYTTEIIGFNKDKSGLYLIDSRNRDTAALFIKDLSSGEQSLIYGNDKVDVSGVFLHPTEKSLRLASCSYLKEELVVLDQSIAEDIAYLKEAVGGAVRLLSISLDDAYWLVAGHCDDGPVAYYKYDRKAKKAVFLFKDRADLDKYQLSKMHPVIIKSRDGLELVSYLTLPYEVQQNNGWQPSVPVPLVLYVHGGPTARDEWGFDGTHQWLANRGYAVLSVNYRGSTGFGKKFLNAGNGEWAGKMHDDLIDAVDWAVANKITTKEKVAIMGGSYGGYAVLVGLTFTPEVFTCGVDIVGPSNLETLLSTMPPYWVPALKALQIKLGADNTTDEGKKILATKSPLSYIERIQKPLLIAQGANDPRVKQSESDQIVAAMKAKNIPVTYVLYPDEGHGFARPVNRFSFFAITEGFLSSCLKGRFEPITDEFLASSGIIQEGKEFLPSKIMMQQKAGQIKEEEPIK